MGKILITEKQLQVLTNLIINEQDNDGKDEYGYTEEEWTQAIDAHPYLKQFLKKLSDFSKKVWANTQKRYLKKGLTLEGAEKYYILQQFQNKLEKSKNPKKLYRRIKHINIRGKNMPVEKTENIVVEPTLDSCPTLQFDIAGIGDKGYDPFVNNSFKLGKGLTDDIQVMIDDIKGLQENYDNKLEVKVLEFDVKTSASRIRNGEQYEGKSFAKLSADRANNVVTTITNALKNIGVEVPSATIDTKGKNGDGSSGPHPRKPYNMVTDSGNTQKIDNKQDRSAYGAPHATDAEYDEYKYCIVKIVITGRVEGTEDEGEVLKKEEEIENVQDWKLTFGYKKRPTIKWPDWRISFKKKYKNPRRKKITSKMLTKCPRWGRKKNISNF